MTRARLDGWATFCGHVVDQLPAGIARRRVQGRCGRGLDPSKPATGVYRNIKVLEGRLRCGRSGMAMEFMAAALGVRCDHCHARGFERDEKPPKEAARRMIQMVRLLNENFDGEPKVSSATPSRPASAKVGSGGRGRRRADSRPLLTASTVLA
ncbi:MAG: photosynthetic reaction center cytochrome c subunit family protein [Planctomycetota bacterium]